VRKTRAVRHAVDRIVLAQGPIGRIRIVERRAIEILDVESAAMCGFGGGLRKILTQPER
jgi:hypothetical protein